MHNKHEALDMSLTTLLKKKGHNFNGLQPGGFLKIWKESSPYCGNERTEYPKRKGNLCKADMEQEWEPDGRIREGQGGSRENKPQFLLPQLKTSNIWASTSASSLTAS